MAYVESDFSDNPPDIQDTPRPPDTHPQSPDPTPSGYGHPIYDQIGALYRGISGGKYTPTQADVSQWGTNVDANYMQNISRAIQGWWSKYQGAQPAAPTPTAPTPATPTPTATPTAPPTTPGGGNGGGGTNVFSDPATHGYEQLLNSLIGRLNQPYQAPGFQPAVDYLNSYFQKLQGPAYTPAQMDLMQTQTLDPMERDHQAARRQIVERLGARGISPSSGIVEKALENLDNQYDTLRTRAQGSFATNAIGLDRQNAAQAAQLGPLIAGMQQQQFAGNEGRALQSANLASIIPQMAWSRLTGAGSAIQPINTPSLLSQLGGFQQQGYGQSSDFTSQLMQALMRAFGGG